MVGSASDSARAQQNAAEKAAGAQEDAASRQLALQEKMWTLSREDLAPYREAGTRGLGLVQDYKDTSPSYDEAVTSRLGAYEEDPGTRAAKALGQQGLQRQLNARGLNYGATGASAGAELGQKYDVAGYDKYKSGLTDRYNALRGENKGQYDRLLDLVKIGQGATGVAVGSNTSNAAAGTGTLAGLGNAQAAGETAKGNIQAQYSSGLGALPANILSMGSSLSTMGGGGWFGNTGGDAAAQATKAKGEFI
jgi:hypothetical protein